MIGRTVRDTYDFEGTRVSPLALGKRSVFRPTFPMGRFVSQPLAVECSNLEEIREFLTTCRYVSDEDQFGKEDYWLAPELFERARKGDCEDFALWTWRQLMRLGYPSRFVVGLSGRYGHGHAWVTCEIDGEPHLVEPLRYWMSRPIPRLSTLRYRPEISVGWDGELLRYYRHREATGEPRFAELPALAVEWLSVWVPLSPRIGRGVVRRAARGVADGLLRLAGTTG